MNATQDPRPPEAVRISSAPAELAGLGPLLGVRVQRDATGWILAAPPR